ncbi:MAG: family 16 glycoside hydrolase [candidate division KSB1 bacterium]
MRNAAKLWRRLAQGSFLFMVSAMTMTSTSFAQTPQWRAHDLTRPKPAVITPGQSAMTTPPSDAVVLFEGKDLSQWSDANGQPTKWKVENGYMEAVKGSGNIRTKQGFGDAQLHIEWASPASAEGKGQDRGNSGVYFMGKYEVQVLDSYQNETYADGQAASIYGQYPPLVNASRGPGEWQSYDILFRRPRFASDGKLLQPARMTVLHNGVLVQDNVELWGPSEWMEYLQYAAHEDKLPIKLQDHGHPVRYRNIWLRELPDPVDYRPMMGKPANAITLAPNVLARYAGTYEIAPNRQYTLALEGDRLFANLAGARKFEIVPLSERKFTMLRTAGDLEFELDDKGIPKGFVFRMGGGEFVTKRVAAK